MDVNRKQRRSHSAEFKAQVLAACAQPGASVAAVALSFKLNDNLVHQWRRGRGANPVPSAASTTVAESGPQFIALSLKAWKFGAKTEAMNAEQRRLFEETLAEDEASLQAQLEQARGEAATPSAADDNNDGSRKPRRRPLPDHLRREDHHHEPENTNCPSPECGQPMVRVGEDISERLDIVPAEFFVHRHIYGKWACRCCECLVQEAVAPQVIDGGMPAAGLVAHTLISRFVDHLPYYRQEAINAPSGVHTPRSTLGSWSGSGGAALKPLYDAHKRFVLSAQVLHADETPVAMLDPGAGKTKRAYVWAYARGAFDPVRGVIYDFCVGRGARFKGLGRCT